MLPGATTGTFQAENLRVEKSSAHGRFFGGMLSLGDIFDKTNTYIVAIGEATATEATGWLAMVEAGATGVMTICCVVC